MTYQFKGKQEAPATVLPGNCGTNAGYRMHITLGTEKCQPCRDAHAEYARKWNRRPRLRSTCGTYAGYMRHKRAEGDACEMCLDAYARYMANYRAKRKAA